MRFSYLIIFLFLSSAAFAQKGGLVEDRMKAFHQLMVNRNGDLNEYIHQGLTYGHSNGWVENAAEFRRNLGNKITYHSFKEDSIQSTVTKRAAHVRFIADIDAALDGKRSSYHLSVVEVWVREGRRWKLFARQAVKRG